MKLHNIKTWLFITLLFALILSVSPVFAGDPNGTWSSSSGATIQLWANMQTVSVTISNNRGSWKYKGWWTRFGDYFSYQVPNSGVRTCSFDKNNSNIIYVKSPDGSWTTWKRKGSSNQGYGYSQPKQKSVSINGVWQSNSGNIFDVSTKGNQVFVTIIRRDGGRTQGIGRWLVYGQKFDYSIQGYPGQAVCTIQNNNTVYVNFGGQLTTWTRR